MHEFFSSGLQNAQSRERVDMKVKMAQATLHIIASAGFGIQAHWAVYDTFGRHEADTGEKSTEPTIRQDLLPFHTSLLLSLENLLPRTVVPEILWTLPISVPWLSTWLKEIQYPFASLEVHMRRLIGAYALEEDTVGASDFGGGEERVFQRWISSRDEFGAARKRESVGPHSPRLLGAEGRGCPLRPWKKIK